MKQGAGYLPLDCPNCGRHRLEYGQNVYGNVVYVECEKCGWNSDDVEDDGARGEIDAEWIPGRWVSRRRETAARGPVHEVDAGRYYGVVRRGLPMIERADTAGAVLHVEDA